MQVFMRRAFLPFFVVVVNRKISVIKLTEQPHMLLFLCNEDEVSQQIKPIYTGFTTIFPPFLSHSPFLLRWH